jgi:hypothetical protein
MTNYMSLHKIQVKQLIFGKIVLRSECFVRRIEEFYENKKTLLHRTTASQLNSLHEGPNTLLYGGLKLKVKVRLVFFFWIIILL